MKSELRYVKDNMVTKADLKAALAELRAETKSDIAEAKSELRAEIAEAKSELRTEIAEAKTELKTAIKDSHNVLLRWMISLFITMIIGFFVPLILK